MTKSAQRAFALYNGATPGPLHVRFPTRHQRETLFEQYISGPIRTGNIDPSNHTSVHRKTRMLRRVAHMDGACELP